MPTAEKETIMAQAPEWVKASLYSALSSRDCPPSRRQQEKDAGSTWFQAESASGHVALQPLYFQTQPAGGRGQDVCYM